MANREIHLNACAWLLNPAPDVMPPAITSGPSVAVFDCSAVVSWTTDEAASSIVSYGPTAAYGSGEAPAGYVQSHAVLLTPLTPASEYHFRAGSTDASGNGPTESADATFMTAAPSAPMLTSPPAATGVASTGATIVWSTDETSTSEVVYGLTASYGSSASSPGWATEHAVTLSGLTPSTTYHFGVLSADGCGNGPTASSDATFTTSPASLDLSGWSLRQYNSTQSFTLPPGTAIPAGGYLVIGRSATLAEFQAFYPGLPGGTVYLNSNAQGSCSAGCFPLINGGESYDLRNVASAVVDGPTVTMSEHLSYQRVHPGDPAGTGASWTTVFDTLANPGAGAGSGSSSGVRINELSDASDFTKEFVELYYDTGGAPDAVPPAAITDLAATPLSSSLIRLSWTATGDDGTTGTAAGYDIRYASERILTAGDFAAAVPLAGEPTPLASGSAQQMTVGPLGADTPYFFAMMVADEAANVSARSNLASGVTAPPGGSTPVSHLVISQIQTGGSTDDAVEIYNPTASPISLSGHSIQYLAANGNFGFRVNLSGTSSVASHGYYLVAANGYAGSAARDDSMGTSNMSASAGHALLVSKISNVTGCADAAIVDKVGYGATASCPEGGAGASVASPTAGSSVSRKPGGTDGHGQDTDVNASDFLGAQASAFHDGASPAATPPGVLGNVKNTLYLSKGASGAELEWARAVGATAYRVYRGTTASFLNGQPAPWETTTVPTTIDATPGSPILFYVVKATDGTAESPE